MSRRLYAFRRIRCRPVFLAILLVAMSAGVVGAQPVTTITGQCKYDSTLGVTRCDYTVFVGAAPVQQVFVPIPETCASCVTASSPFFESGEPTFLKDPVCGNGFGIYLTATTPVTKMAKATLAFEGLCSLGVVMSKIRTGVTVSECHTVALPGVVRCAAPPYIEWTVDATDLEIDVRKAGVYASQLIAMGVTSNTNCTVSFGNFGPLIPDIGSASIPLPVRYQISDRCEPIPPEPFLMPDQFNALRLLVAGNEIPVVFCLWGRFDITVEHTPSEYDREAVIILQMENHEVFIESSP